MVTDYGLGKYWHSECSGCASYGIECDPSCEYDDDPNSRTCYTSKYPSCPAEDETYYPDYDDDAEAAQCS